MATKATTTKLEVPTIVYDDASLKFIPSGHAGMFVEIYEDPTEMTSRLVNEQEMEATLVKARKIEQDEKPPPAPPKRPEGVPEGHDWWHESGVKHAPKVDPSRYGSHNYPGAPDHTSDCSHGCGCWMGPARSGGPVNPHGRCPNNPIAKKQEEG